MCPRHCPHAAPWSGSGNHLACPGAFPAPGTQLGGQSSVARHGFKSASALTAPPGPLPSRCLSVPAPQRWQESSRRGSWDQEFFGKAVKPWDGTEQVLLTSLLLRLTITTNICITYLCYARTSRKMTLVSKVSEYPYNSKQDMGIKDTEPPPPPQGVDGRLKMRRRCLTQARRGWGLGRSARPLTCSQSELTLLRC